MRDFPDMTVTFDKLEPRGDRTAFHWTFAGTYAGTGNHVRISGCELWKIDNAGLIAESSGHFDAAVRTATARPRIVGQASAQGRLRPR